MRDRSAFIILAFWLFGLCGCMTNRPPSFQLGKPSTPVAAPVDELSDEEYSATMAQVEELEKSGQEWESAMPTVLRGELVSCWYVEDIIGRRRGYDWTGHPITTGWVPPMDDVTIGDLKALAVSLRRWHKSIRLIPCYPGGSDGGRYRVRALSTREILKLARFIEILEVKEPGANLKAEPKRRH